MVGGQNGVVFGRFGRVEVEELGEEGGGEGRVVEEDEALGDGEVVGRREGFEELDQELENLRNGWSACVLKRCPCSQTHLALVASARTAHCDTFPHDNVQDPLEQARILRLVKDPLHNVEAMGRERDSEGLYSVLVSTSTSGV